MRKKRTRSFSLVSALLLALAAILPVFTSVSAQDDRPILIHATNAGDKATFDPHLASGTQDRTVVDMVFNGLLRFKPGDASVIEPDLATAVPEPVAEADGTQSWTFTLRTDARCHASTKTESYVLTADDVVFSLQKAANADTSGVAGAYAGYTFTKVDDVTVKVTVATPYSLGNDTKTKVFWVEPCATDTPSEAPTETATQSAGAASTDDTDQGVESQTAIAPDTADTADSAEADTATAGAAVPTSVDAGEDSSALPDWARSPWPLVAVAGGLTLAGVALARRKSRA